MGKLKPIPAFKTEAEERKFWESHDCRLEQGRARALSKAEAFDYRDFNSAAAGLAGSRSPPTSATCRISR
jgi:hypothetical protein